MYKNMDFRKKINTKIIAVMLFLFTITTVVVSVLSQYNLRRIYENNFTQRVLLSNGLIATMINVDDVVSYVDLLRNQDDSFKKRQVQFFNDREELFLLQEKGAAKEEQNIYLNRMKSFHDEMRELKSDRYWAVVKSLKHLRELSRTKYVYVFSDTGVAADDGTKLYTYIFDAEDDDEYSRPDNDGLGTVNTGVEVVAEIYRTKNPMNTVMYYNGDYGELYYAYAPVLDEDGNIIAILGTDVDLEEMHREISKSMIQLNIVFSSFIILIILAIYIFVNRYITRPLGGLTDTAQQLADGNVYALVPAPILKQNGELGMLANAINAMSSVYQNMIKSSEDLFDATRIGKLDVRNDSSKYKGDIKKVIQQINDTLDAITIYLNGVPEGIFIMSKNFEMYFRNRQYIKFFGNMPLSEFLRKIFPEGSEVTPEQLGKKFTELLEQPNNNTTIWVNDFCFSITLKEINLSGLTENSVLGIAVDITDLITAKQNAQAAAKAKSDFLSRMSHEMRTPMNAITGMVRIAEKTDDLSKLKYCLSTIGNSSKLLLGIINDVLDMSKIEAGKFELENAPVNIKKMLMKIINIISENVEKKNQKFDMLLDERLFPEYVADELRLSQIITNLLSNAVKFTPENGKITLTVNETDRLGEEITLRFSISDTGIGMTKEQIGRLFTSFEQADGSITRRFGGTGLGLAISKNIVEKMGGRIWVESEYGSGSIFTFEVKLKRASSRDAVGVKGPGFKSVKQLISTNNDDITENAQQEIPDFSGISVLLAEDIEINREIFAALLSETRISIDTAENGLIAVSKFRENPDKYDLIIMDIQMPGVDGYEATKMIRALDIPGAKTVPIIAMTANAFKEDMERCLVSGMNDYLSKPINEKAVLEKIIYYSTLNS